MHGLRSIELEPVPADALTSLNEKLLSHLEALIYEAVRDMHCLSSNACPQWLRAITLCRALLSCTRLACMLHETARVQQLYGAYVITPSH